MVTQSPVKMFPGLGMRENFNNNNTSNEDLSKELGMMLREQRRYEVNDRERELNLYRSGSAPPTVEGSLAAVGGFFNQSNSHTNHTSEEEIRSDPEYLSYYYRNVNMNPRLPPPILSKEDWRLAQRMKTAGGSSPHGGIGDRRRNTENRSLFSQQPGLPPHHAHKESSEAAAEELQSGRSSLTRQPSAEWFERGSDGLIGLSSGGGLGARRKSLADMLQEDLVRPSAAPPRPPSRPASRNAFDADAASMEALRSTSQIPSLSRVQSLGSQSSHGFASALAASLSRNQTPEPQPVIARSPSPCPPGMGGRFGVVDKQTLGHSNSYNGVSSSVNESVPNLYKGVQSSVDTGVDLAAKLSGIKLSCMEEELHGRSNLQDESLEHRNYSFHIQNSAQQQQNSSKGNSEDGPRQATQLLNHSSLQRPSHGLSQNSKGLHDTKVTSVTSQMMADRNDNNQYSRSVASNFSSSVGDPTQTPANISRSEGGIGTHTRPNVPEAHAPNYGISGYPLNPHLPSMMSGYGPTSGLPPAYDHIAACLDSGSMQTSGSSRAIPDLQSLYHLNNQMGGGPQMPVDPLYIQYLQRATAEYAAQMSGLSDPSGMRNYMGGSSYLDFLEFQKAYMAALFNHQKSQYAMPYLGKGGNINPAYYANPSFGLAMPFVGSPIASPILPSSPVAPASPPFRSHDRSHRFPYGARNSGLAGSWNSESGFHGEDFSSSLLEEFKSNKTRSFELSEIAGHVFEFSSDQHGSRFIQQKLEGATEEDKNIVFEEIFPHALDLMTDVFGNYVIQKFFEHGTPKQRKDLANKLTGHIVALSLQMYGCRVIQKAIEVVDDDQKAQMVLELDGHVMRCVRDQNGNHVIQKCIECIPQEKIQFIISSFLGQVVALSTHAYGCRVIQRVLEHCTDSNTQSIMMEEIMQAVCPLAEDQYGNYVVQHVLEHGKPHERTAVIRKLAGQIVQMSRQKFASNVVEKCLVFGSPAEREILIVEMLGSTDENEPLQEMMKDQFANYVVQKVLETCDDDQQRELILSRIRVHLNALKKYTFGKHIVSRVEKLVTAGEKRSSSGSRSDQP